MKNYNRVGIVLEGGGAKGAYHIGAIRALNERNIIASAITGTSIGAINAALYAQGDFKRLYDLYNNFDASLIFGEDDEFLETFEIEDIKFKDIPSITKVLFTILKNGGIDISPLKKLIEVEIDEKKLRDSDIDFGLVSISISDFKITEAFIEDIDVGEIKTSILASCYLPFFKKTTNKRLLDGGFWNNIPFSLLLEKGPFDKVFIIRTLSSGFFKKDGWDSDYVEIIKPSISLGHSMLIKEEKIRFNMEMGYLDTIRVLDGLEGEYYYLESIETNFFNVFKLLSEKDIEIVKGIISLNNYKDSKRTIFESFVPELAKILSLENSTYQEIGLKLLEEAATILGLERNTIYSWESFIRNIKIKIENYKVDDYDLMDKISLEIAKITKGKIGETKESIIQLTKIILGGIK